MVDLKSPLKTVQLPHQQQIYSQGNRTLDQISANENNILLNLPAQVEPEQPTIVKTNQPSNQPQRNTERKPSLATVAKNLDSILEDSEHDSSTCLAKSEQLEHDAIENEANLVQFQKDTESLVTVQQDVMLEYVLKATVTDEVQAQVEQLEQNLDNNHATEVAQESI